MSSEHIVHIVPALFGVEDGISGGAERYAYELARHMASQIRTTLVTFGEKQREERLQNLSIKVIRSQRYVRGQRTNPFSWSLFSAISRATVVHCHQQHVVASSAAALFCRVTNRRVFVSDLGGGGWDLSGYISTDRLFHGHLHISEYSRSICGHSANSASFVIGGGVDVNKFLPNPSLPRSGKILFVGRILPHKGIGDLIEAIEADMTLEIIGSNMDQRYWKDLQKIASGKDILFRTECNDESLVKEYQSCLCVVLPSVYRTIYGDETKVPELLGQTLMEAMACAVPVICTNVGGMPEVVDDGLTGFVVPPNDPAVLREKIRWIRDHPGEAKTMGEKGRARVLEKFTWDEVVNRCLQIYRGSGAHISDVKHNAPQKKIPQIRSKVKGRF